ncbi:hypothetical protein FPZ12_043290 [Amycolatopsis acidicola]|uniref:FtsX extracellular domain-containing protein n=1 Tax=Amycolatopsis acidicola TaxID=2596893 RepID=A0A5N0UNM0_9PSEU|nr:hypothetical protein [Amycolatopsis acidicola]KAA9149464.1 hypothetical protein FPZ12_043290 [Amycolatopsis acidicola]
MRSRAVLVSAGGVLVAVVAFAVVAGTGNLFGRTVPGQACAGSAVVVFSERVDMVSEFVTALREDNSAEVDTEPPGMRVLMRDRPSAERMLQTLPPVLRAMARIEGNPC